MNRWLLAVKNVKHVNMRPKDAQVVNEAIN